MFALPLMHARGVTTVDNTMIPPTCTKLCLEIPLSHSIFFNLIQVKDGINKTLIEACKGGRIRTAWVELLLDQGAEVNYQDEVRKSISIVLFME